jgi:hypothetical protein
MALSASRNQRAAAGSLTSTLVPRPGGLVSFSVPPSASASLDGNHYHLGVRVLGDVRQRLRDDVVRPELDTVWQPACDPHGEVHRHGRAPG